MIRFYAIFKNTFVQTIRQPIYGVLILVTFAVLLLSVTLAGWTMGTDYRASDQRMLETLGLSTLLVAGLLVGAFSASSVLSREIEDQTALTVISKPVLRATFVLGKFAGVLAAVSLGFYLCSLVFLMTVRHRVVSASFDPYDVPVIVLGTSAFVLGILSAMVGNYFFGWSIISAAVWSSTVLLTLAMGILSFVGKEWAIVPLGHDTLKDLAIHGQLLVGMALIFMAVMIFVAVAVAASTRLGQVMTLGLCCAVFFVGSMHQSLFGRWGDEIVAVRVMGWIAPDLTSFFPLDALNKDVTIPARYVATAGGYCALYMGGILALGIALFERRQLEPISTSGSIPGAVALLGWTGRMLGIAGAIVGLVLLSLPGFHGLTGLGLIAGILLAAALSWKLFSAFAGAAPWAYWTLLVVAVLALGALIAAVFFPAAIGFARAGPLRVIAVTGASVAMVVILILGFPKTRRHFQSSA